MKFLLIDDEPKARNVLRHYIETFIPETTELMEASSVDDALSCLRHFKPQIVFLDIEMPVKNGFDFLRSLKEIPFDVIFTTAYNQYAIQAVRFSALDYLLKPVDPEELMAAIERYKNKKEKESGRELYQNLVDNINHEDIRRFRIAVPSIEGVQFFMVNEILRLEAEGSYTRIFLTTRKPFVASRTLKHFEEMLENFQFARTHKSHLVNLVHTKGMTADRDFLVLSDNSTVEISRRKKEEIMHLLGLK
jgi:two-component system, LytTR family, response regulator